MEKLIMQFFEEYKGQYIHLFLANGSQVNGLLLDADDTHVKISTHDFNNECKTVLVAHSAVITFVPDRK